MYIVSLSYTLCQTDSDGSDTLIDLNERPAALIHVTSLVGAVKEANDKALQLLKLEKNSYETKASIDCNVCVWAD